MLAGIRRFLWFRWSHDAPLLTGIDLAECVLTEADALLADPHKQPLTVGALVGMQDSALLSGVQLANGSKLYRFTPSDEGLPAQIVASSPATFLIGGETKLVPVAGGVLHAPPAQVESCAPGGYWIFVQ
jgi:hypothetical protein